MTLPYQARVIEEKQELDERLRKLQGFLDTSSFIACPVAERQRLVQQESVMREYSEILGKRIAAFALPPGISIYGE